MYVRADRIAIVPQLLTVRVDQHLPPQLHVLLDPPTLLVELPGNNADRSMRESRHLLHDAQITITFILRHSLVAPVLLEP